MLLRFLLMGTFATLVYRILRDLWRSIASRVTQAGPTPTKEKKQPPWDVDKARITDADFHDLDN
jgi:hypothetical protein